MQRICPLRLASERGLAPINSGADSRRLQPARTYLAKKYLKRVKNGVRKKNT